MRARRGLLLVVALCACSDTIELDLQGQHMLDPMRFEALRVPELVLQLGLAPGDVVADIGAGPGFLTLPIAQAVPDGRVIATDLRADYLSALEKRAAYEGLRNISTRVVSADDPGLEPGTIDLALMCQVDHALRDRAGYFEQLRRALRRNGRIALVNYQRFKEADLEALSNASLRVVDEWQPSAQFFLVVAAP